MMGIDAACSDDFMVNGKQVLSLLPSVCLVQLKPFCEALESYPFSSLFVSSH